MCGCVCVQSPPSVCACVGITGSGKYLAAHTRLSLLCGCDETYQLLMGARLTTTTNLEASFLLLRPLILNRALHAELGHNNHYYWGDNKEKLTNK